MRSYADRIWYRDDVTSAQKSALRELRAITDGAAKADDLRARLSTLRALHRFGLVRATTDIIEADTVVTITQSGMDSIADDNPS